MKRDLAFADDAVERAEGDNDAVAQALAVVWELVRAAERAVLDQTSVAQLAARTSPREWII